MQRTQRLVGGIVAAALAVALAGCSIDAVIWGPEGTHVIQTTEELVSASVAGDASALVCADSVADLGEPADWVGLSAGEPESFVPDFWKDQAPLDPQWSINLEGLPEGLQPGSTFPGDVFYRDTDDGLCVIDVVWSTLAEVG